MLFELALEQSVSLSKVLLAVLPGLDLIQLLNWIQRVLRVSLAQVNILRIGIDQFESLFCEFATFAFVVQRFREERVQGYLQQVTDHVIQDNGVIRALVTKVWIIVDL